jgi:hypothetical protein
MRGSIVCLGLVALSGLGGCDDSAEASKQGADLSEDGEMFEENIRPGEAEEFAGFAEKIQSIQEAHAANNGGAVKRGFHAKVHACVRAELSVLEDVPEEARHGVFAEPHTYPAWVRLSNGQGKTQDDRERDVRGLAIKIVGVEGKKLLEIEEDAKTQDFLMTNRAASHVDDAAEFMEFAEATTSTLKFAGYLATHPKVALRLAKVKKDVPSLLSEQYWSGGAYKLGPRATKFSARPCEPLAKEMPKDPSPDYLREDFGASLAQADACFELMVQFQSDPAAQPIERASVEWKESEAPFVPVARLRIPKQELDVPENAERAAAEAAYCEKLSFTPWHALPDHRPLGHINRARKAVYQASREHRSVDEYVPEPDGTETF